MKKTLIFALLLSLLLVSCANEAQETSTPDTPTESVLPESKPLDSEFAESVLPESEDTSVETRETWTEVSQFGDTHVTREYRDFGKEHTVTSKTYSGDFLKEKSIVEWKGDQKISSHAVNYNKNTDGTEFSQTDILTYDESGKVATYYTETAYFDKTAKEEGVYIYDGDETAKEGTTEIIAADGTKISEGTVKYEDFRGGKYTVERETCYKNGEIDYFAISAYNSSYTYFYHEYLDAEENKLLSSEKGNGKTVYTVFVEGGGSWTEESSNRHTYNELDGTMIATGTFSDNTFVADDINGSYTDLKAAERVSKIIELYYVTISELIYPLQ